MSSCSPFKVFSLAINYFPHNFNVLASVTLPTLFLLFTSDYEVLRVAYMVSVPVAKRFSSVTSKYRAFNQIEQFVCAALGAPAARSPGIYNEVSFLSPDIYLQSFARRVTQQGSKCHPSASPPGCWQYLSGSWALPPL